MSFKLIKYYNYYFFIQRSSKHLVYTILENGMYLLTVTVKPINIFSEPKDNQNKFTTYLEVSMQGPHGFLSATNWPLLHVIYFINV